MDTEKRFLTALTLTLLFLYLWYEFFLPKPKPGPEGAPTQTESISSSEAPGGTATPSMAGPSGTEVQATPGPRPITPAIPARTSVQETSTARLTWTNQPASLAELRLENYRTALPEEADKVNVVPLRGEAPPPFQWRFEINGQNFSDEGASYREVRADAGGVVYERELAPAITLQKRFHWNAATYTLEHEVEIRNNSPAPLKVAALTGLFSGHKDNQKRSWLSFGVMGDPVRVSAYINEKMLHWTDEDIKEKEEIPQGDIAWAGFDSRYFLLAAIPLEGRWSGLEMNMAREDELMDLRLVYPARDIAVGATQKWGLTLFAGPKDIGILREVGSSLDRSIDLGNWLGPIARPILDFLRWLYRLIPNYGAAIILLTFMVRLAMFPLAQMQAKSMRRMQEHKPEMDALKEKYKDNKEAYSRELMGYMRKHRINPMGGCLLLLPQMPVFFALYRVLYNSIELRHEPFIFWIQDLAARDPYFVTPLLLGVTMYMQQRMTPMPTADPAQQKMMKLMPVLFTVFMIGLPAGLNLYIFVSTLWGVGQQYWVQRGVVPVPQKKSKVRNKS